MYQQLAVLHAYSIRYTDSLLVAEQQLALLSHCVESFLVICRAVVLMYLLGQFLKFERQLVFTRFMQPYQIFSVQEKQQFNPRLINLLSNVRFPRVGQGPRPVESNPHYHKLFP
jgi:hypothetical protein